MLLNRLKIFLILFILAFLSVLFWQNQELLSLKLLCPDVNQSCLYRTPQLPLAVWMLVFTSAGVITSLVLQLLNYLSTKGSNQSKSSASTSYYSDEENRPRNSQTKTKVTNPQPSEPLKQPISRSSVETKTKVNPPSSQNFTTRSDWEDDSRHDDWDKEESTKEKAPKQSKDNQRQNLSKDSATTPSSDTAYSYKFRPANKNKDREVERVYDANYRVIDSSSRKNVNEQVENQQDDDEEWI